MTHKTRIKIHAGIALLAIAGTQSLHADLRGDLLEIVGTSDIGEARLLVDAAKKAGQPEGWYLSGKLAMLDYNFPQAQKDFAEYRRIAKIKKYNRFDTSVAEAMEGVKEGNLQFDRFRDIVVIDAIKVKKDKFFKHLRLPLSAGRIVDVDEIPGDAAGRGEAGFISEGGDFMMWSDMFEDDISDNGETFETPYIAETNVLTDGTLSTPKPIRNLGEDADYPFLTGDGMTLYYSAYGENTVGGRDIFIATRDPQTGEYRTPVNAGFPFNSAADDYLLVIDEENGVGWWATDRHLLEDEVVLYVFLLPDGRKNYEGTPDEKRDRGILDNIRVTWTSTSADDDADDEDDEADGDSSTEKTPEQLAEEQAERERFYQEKAAEIRKIKPGQKPRRHDCMIPIAPGKYIYSADDVKTSRQRQLVEEYILKEKDYNELKGRLGSLRKQYASNPTDNLRREIETLEISEEKGRIELITILSALYHDMGIN